MTGRRLELSEVAGIIAAAAGPEGTSQLIATVGALIAPVLGAKGFTMFRYLHETGEVERIYSSDPKAYPVGGRKRTEDYPQSQQVLARGDVYIARNEDDIRQTYRDADLIFSIGVTSIMNVPIRYRAENIGAINVLGVANQFTEDNAADGRILAGLLIPAVLTWDH